jgi:hypothetical protein
MRSEPIATTFLPPDAPVPVDRPFTARWARAQGVDARRLRAWVRQGLLVSPVRGVLHAAQLPDDLALRIECLRLVVPPDAVVTDRSAGWLHGAPMVLAPNAHLQVPPVDLFRPPGGRIRRTAARSGQRELWPGEVEDGGGVRVTTRLRTTCDLGMQLPRRQAFAGICSMLKVADFTRAAISTQADGRFKGHRWVRQLRALAPLSDPRFESPGECNLALIWHDTPGLPPFEPQLQVPGPRGSYFLDLAVPELRYAAEYDGRQWHGEDQHEADHARRTWLAEEEGWRISVFVDDDVRGTGQKASDRLMRDIVEARQAFGPRAWTNVQSRSADSARL